MRHHLFSFHHAHHHHTAACSLAAVGCALWCAATAAASVGPVIFDGGSPPEQAQVIDALSASSFDWSILPNAITVHIGSPSGGDFATPGEVYLDSSLLDSGEFSWGVVQHEFGHQVDFLLLHDDDRAQLEGALHAKDWCYKVPGLAHADQGCERFASELSWAYWPSFQNSMRPGDIGGESAGMPSAAFRALVAELLQTPGASTLAPSVQLPAPTLTRHPHSKAVRQAQQHLGRSANGHSL
jgi:hypothetical protein